MISRKLVIGEQKDIEKENLLERRKKGGEKENKTYLLFVFLFFRGVVFIFVLILGNVRVRRYTIGGRLGVGLLDPFQLAIARCGSIPDTTVGGQPLLLRSRCYIHGPSALSRSHLSSFCLSSPFCSPVPVARALL